MPGLGVLEIEIRYVGEYGYEAYLVKTGEIIAAKELVKLLAELSRREKRGELI